VKKEIKNQAIIKRSSNDQKIKQWSKSSSDQNQAVIKIKQWSESSNS
jgi:hypothetical protein